MGTASRRTLLLGALGAAAGCSAAPEVASRSAGPARAVTGGTLRTRVMSFNVLTSNRGAADFDASVPAADALVQNRAPVMAAWIRRAAPDVIGVQENEALDAAALPLRALAPLLPEFTPVLPDLNVPFLVRSSSYVIEASEAVDISQGYYSRHVAWVRLTSRRTGGSLLVANTHLDPYQRPEMAKARLAEVTAILAVLRRLDPALRRPVVLLGDLNLRPDARQPDDVAALRKLSKAGLHDAAEVAARDLSEPRGVASVNGLGTVVDGRWCYRAIRTDGLRYDYILTSAGVGVRSWQVVTGPGVRRIDGHPYFADGPVPSDHCPVQAELSIPPS